MYINEVVDCWPTLDLRLLLTLFVIDLFGPNGLPQAGTVRGIPEGGP